MKEGYRKIIVGAVFLVIGIIMVFALHGFEIQDRFLTFLERLGGLVIAGNGVEWISKGVGNYRKNRFNDIGE